MKFFVLAFLLYSSAPGIASAHMFDSNVVVCSSSAVCPWSGSVWNNYPDQSLIECSSDQTASSKINVTSGCLFTKVSENAHYGFTETYNFRMIADAKTKRGKTIWWADQAPEYQAIITRWHDTAPDYSYAGIHIFARYHDEDNLYVASWRHDGYITVKKKINGVYTTLASQYYGVPLISTPYVLQLTTTGNELKFLLDNTVVLTAADDELTSGTVGIRTDYVDTQFDNWRN